MVEERLTVKKFFSYLSQACWKTASDLIKFINFCGGVLAVIAIPTLFYSDWQPIVVWSIGFYVVLEILFCTWGLGKLIWERDQATTKQENDLTALENILREKEQMLDKSNEKLISLQEKYKLEVEQNNEQSSEKMISLVETILGEDYALNSALAISISRLSRAQESRKIKVDIRDEVDKVIQRLLRLVQKIKYTR